MTQAMQTTSADLDRQAVRRIASTPFWGLAESVGASFQDQVITADLVPTIQAAKRALGFDLAPATQAELNVLLSACLALTGGSWSDQRFEEFLKIAITTLSNDPGDLVRLELINARRACRFASELVPYVTKAIAEDTTRRKRNAKIILRIEAECVRLGLLAQPVGFTFADVDAVSVNAAGLPEVDERPC